VDGEDEEFAHGVNATRIGSTRKTAPHRRIPSYCEFATHNFVWYNTNRPHSNLQDETPQQTYLNLLPRLAQAA
jgi:hypothetical protein